MSGIFTTPPSNLKSQWLMDAKIKTEQDEAEAKHPKLLNKISGLFNNQKFSDVTIKIFDVVFHAHQIVICTQSEYFDKAFQNGSQGFIEADTKTIEFKEGSGAAYWRVFEYMYTGAYSDHLSTSELIDDPELLKDVRVFALADMFLIEDLKTISETKFEKKIQNCQLNTLFTACVREVYKNTHRYDSKMRTAIVGVAVNLVKKWEKGHHPIFSSGLLELYDFKNLLREGGDFVVDYCMALSGISSGTGSVFVRF